MVVIVLGIVVFFGLHMLPAFQIQRGLVAQFGEAGYKIGFSLGSFLGLGLIIWGMTLANFVHLWSPASWARGLAIGLMPLAVILVCAADAPNNLKRFVRHPMLIGITLWALLHLAANGDLASTLLFGSFLVFSVLDIWLVESSGRFTPKEPVSPLWDVGVVAIGLALYGVLFYFHGNFTGMPLY